MSDDENGPGGVCGAVVGDVMCKLAGALPGGGLVEGVGSAEAVLVPVVYFEGIVDIALEETLADGGVEEAGPLYAGEYDDLTALEALGGYIGARIAAGGEDEREEDESEGTAGQYLLAIACKSVVAGDYLRARLRVVHREVRNSSPRR